MPKSRIIVTLGVLIALMPLLGFPRAWESFFQVLAGLSIALLSVWANIDKRLMLKAKAQKRQAHKHLQAQIQAEQAEQLSKPQEEQV
ncbi:MAG: hypothetical protein A2832_02325 [Candidatus Zambryskibacteria bacterium RIFCSPHIGHO2_01_FULL_44_22b]|uniref:Uncharacterized protein n=1 Tax=Candidatus Zambryskibacteria bacterium RIFCSPHIGHO2_01_FULL_44_22b TaxID=1802737 RepID=A0A1G2T2Q8_9BACT|nr:MAG: hypothetical protein A3A98_02480 [Candidatus Staskawiczbacteria bacterium RIFCSPLOWO2_01_FULL_40_39]OHA91422.1 MAG: hypothetical protein A2832_02325 [Candidatus Zambryskibacteria bacterium RIFCSPHIGHO2_01_FULL_44_22b]